MVQTESRMLINLKTFKQTWKLQWLLLIYLIPTDHTTHINNIMWNIIIEGAGIEAAIMAGPLQDRIQSNSFSYPFNLINFLFQ